jgi:circadian clock protein KaiC
MSTDLPEVQSRLPSGVEGLDSILSGGFQRNRLYLVEGDPGTGKTTLALQFLLEGARNGEAGLYVTLSETAEELAAGAASHGWSLESAGLHIHELVPLDETQSPETTYTLFHPSELELGETMRAVFDEVDRVQPGRVVFDSLSEMRLMARESLRYRRQILALKQYFVGRQCSVLLLDDRSPTEGTYQLHSLVHGVIRLEQLAMEYGISRRRLRVLKMRGSDYRGGYHDYEIKYGGLVIFPRLIAAEHHQGYRREPVTSDIAPLDALLGGGLDRGTSTLMMGPAGAGKSTIAARYALAAAERGENAAIFTFDEAIGSLFTRLAGLGMDIERKAAEGKIKVRQVDPAEMSPGEFFAIVRRCVERDSVRVVVIDSLNGLLNAMAEERYLLIQLHEVLTYLGQLGVVTIMVVSQAGLMGSSMTSPVDVSYLADTLVLFRYFEATGEVRKAISVVKKRSGSHEHSIREFSFNSEGIHVGEPIKGFQGVLTGVPHVVGSPSAVIGDGNDRNGS